MHMPNNDTRRLHQHTYACVWERWMPSHLSSLWWNYERLRSSSRPFSSDTTAAVRPLQTLSRLCPAAPQWCLVSVRQIRQHTHKFLYTPHNKISSYHHWNVNLLLEKWAVFLLTTVLWGIGYWPTKKLPILITEGSAWSWSRPQVVTRRYVAITFCQACGYLPSRRASPPLASSKLYWLVPEAHKCKQLAQCCYAAFARSRIWTHDQMLIASPTLYPLHHRATHKDNTK